MDRPLSAVLGDGGLHWPDSHGINSDDGQSVGLSSPWLAPFSAGSTSACFSHTGQLSPISNGNGADPSCGSADSSASLTPASPSQSPPMTTSAQSAASSSACPAPAYLGHAGLRSDEGEHGMMQHATWEEDGAGERLAIAKSEPLDDGDDDFCMDDLQEAPSPSSSHAPKDVPGGLPDQPMPKRPRGRPRKHPLAPSAAVSKITKGRSKTGCLTCRKRKKKCDEAKPRCE